MHLSQHTCVSVFQICLKGKVHIFKYLNIQACRLDKKPDTLDLPSLGKRCLPQPLTDRYQNVFLLLLHICPINICPHVRDVTGLFSMSLAWKIFILARIMVLILELVVTVGTRGCLQLRYEAVCMSMFQQHYCTVFFHKDTL